MLRTEHSPEQIRIYREGWDAPLVVQNAFAGKRPYIHPVCAPDGAGVVTEDAPPHHPWQHGLYVGLNDVNGVGFWTEKETDGTFHPEPLRKPVTVDGFPAWGVRTAWRDPAGKPLLTEVQNWHFEDRGDYFLLRLAWSLAADTDLRFGAYPYGGLFLRMPFRAEVGGVAENSEGQRNADAEGQRARWVAVTMPVEGRETPVTVAILDGPDNPEHPTPWRVDGQLGVSPSRSIAGAWTLARGEMASFAYVVVVQTGEPNRALIEEVWGTMGDGA
jgi:hypothetical protein